MGKGGSVAKAAMQLTPIIFYMTFAYALMALGLYALIEDQNVTSDACGKQYHVWKYSILNMALWVFATTTFCFSSPWKGGEGARARALVLTIFYSAFFVWGVLLALHLSELCTHVMDEQYHVLYLFLQASIPMNGITAVLFFVHECFLGTWMQADLTLMAEVYHKYNMPAQPPRTMDGGGPLPSTINAGPNMQSEHPPGDLSPQNAYEYDKIMQNTPKTSGGSGTTLPDVVP